MTERIPMTAAAEVAGQFKPGAVIEVGHPFMRDTFDGFDSDGPFRLACWRPGVYFEERLVPPDGHYTDCYADAVGKQILTIVSVHKPGRWPTRIFYTREWEDPDGKRFGKAKLFCRSAAAFRILTNGYRHLFDLKYTPAAPPAAMALRGQGR